jgi:hypothetical protein
MGHALTFPHHARIRDGESACIGEGAPDLQPRSGSLEETFTLLCGEHGRAIDARRRVRNIEAQL